MMKKHKPRIGDYVMAECYKAELAKVKKQLAIAVEALNEYAEEDNWEDCHAGFLDSSIDYGCYGYYGYQQAQEALLKIKEFDNA